MASCGYCETLILFGGVTAEGQRFCNQKCYQSARILSVSNQIPNHILEQHVEETWRGNCPKCGGPGPVDVHLSHQVWSALFLTQWSSKMHVSCHSCGVKRQLGAAAFSFFFGWWGFPWGLVLTPVQITRNVIGVARGSHLQPSAQLRKLARVNLGAKLLAKQNADRQNAAAQPPPLNGRG